MVKRSKNVVAIIQARMRSTRLPGKVLLDLAGKPVIFHIIERVKRIPALDAFVIATTGSKSDDPIVDYCLSEKWEFFRGDEADVLDRHYRAAQKTGAGDILRVTADCPLFCHLEANKMIELHIARDADYTHNINVLGVPIPIGGGCEVFKFSALEKSWKEGHAPHHREHVDEYAIEHPDIFKTEKVLPPPEIARKDFRLTLDTQQDLSLFREIFARLYRPPDVITLAQAISLLDDNPALLEINRHIIQKRY